METEVEATNPVAEDAVAPEAPEVADEAHAQGDEQDQIEQEADDGQSEDDLEEVEHEGQKYRLPKALKPALMMQADYTRKTQELAEQRKTQEAQAAERAESFEALRQDHVRVHMLETQVKAFEQVDWATYRAQDPDAARIHYDQYRELKDALGDAKSELSAKEAERLESQRASTAKALEETRMVLAQDIKGWGPQLAEELVNVAGEFGYSAEQLLSNPNPRDFKLLHELHSLRQQVKKQATTKRQEAVTSVQPAKTVGAKSAPPIGLDDRLSTEEWVRRRNAQEAARRKANGR